MKILVILIVLVLALASAGITETTEMRIPLDGEALVVDPGYHTLKVGKEGRIYLADVHNYTIKMFSPEGKYLSEFGSKGEGPGQFKRWFGEYTIGRDGTIYQLDFWSGNRSISIFSPEGEYRKRITIKLEGNFGPERIFSLKDGNFLVICGKGIRRKRLGSLVFMGSTLHHYLIDGRGNILKDLFQLTQYFDFSTAKGQGWPAIPYRVSVLSAYDDSSGLIAYQKNSEDVVHFHDVGSDAGFELKNGFTRDPLTLQDLKRFLEEEVKQNVRRQSFEPYYRALIAYGRSVEEFKPIVNRIFFDPAGDLHVAGYDVAKKLYTVNVITPGKGWQRRYQSAEIPSYFFKDKMYYLSYDEDEDITVIRVASGQ